MIKSKEARHLITSIGPEFPNNIPEMNAGHPDAFRLVAFTDGTNTVVNVMLENEMIGVGIARRKPGDERDPDLGMALALTRAFTDVATRYAATLDRMLGSHPDPSAEFIKTLKDSAKHHRREKKDMRRKAARQRFLIDNGGPWQPPVTKEQAEEPRGLSIKRLP